MLLFWILNYDDGDEEFVLKMSYIIYALAQVKFL